MQSFDAIVIGLGAMGASACFHLARRGVKVLGLEQFAIGHARGSSHGHSRMIRKAYFEHPNYVPLLHRAYALWDELEAISGRRLLYRTGGLFIGPREGALVAGALSAAKLHSLPHELLDVPELRRRYPQFVVPEAWHAFCEPDAGFLLPERVIQTHAQEALRLGALLHTHEPVRSWERDGNGYVVRTDQSTYHAGALIFCGGPWSAKLLAELKLPLKVTRQVLAWVWPREPVSFELGRIPVWAIDSLDGGLYYGFPMNEESLGMKLAHHLPSDAFVDPDGVSRIPEPADAHTVRKVLADHLPSADGPLLALQICLYTNSPDGHFILDHHPEHPNVQIAAGFSGHGFKFSSVIGELLAEAALEGKDNPATDFLRLSRLR